MKSERVAKESVRLGFQTLVCPRCGCREYFDMRPQVAWCWASGLIEIGDAMPVDTPDGCGAIEIARGAKSELQLAMSVMARHGYGDSAGKLLVPGVPECGNERDKADALAGWLKQCSGTRRGMARRGWPSVSFSCEASHG
jgi:hypothetical protein